MIRPFFIAFPLVAISLFRAAQAHSINFPCNAIDLTCLDKKDPFSLIKNRRVPIITLRFQTIKEPLIAYKYDKSGNTTEMAFFTLDGRPITNKDKGASRITWYYNNKGKLTSTAFFDEKNLPVLDNTWGAARVDWRYDKKGNEIEEAYFGLNGEAISEKNAGVARVTWLHTQSGKQITTTYYDTIGKPVLNKEIGAALVTSRYDKHGRRIYEAFFDIKMRPIMNRKVDPFGDWAAAVIETQYDRTGKRTQTMYAGFNGHPISQKHKNIKYVIWKYDENERAIGEAYFDQNKQAVLRQDIGVSRITYKYKIGRAHV